MAGKKGRPRKLLHQLSNIDEERRVADCAKCGKVRVYEAKGSRARVSNVAWVCGARNPNRGVGGGVKHHITAVDEKTQSGTCAVCGTVQLIWRKYEKGLNHVAGRWACPVGGTLKSGRDKYVYREGYKRVVCPFCNVHHRWDRDQGAVCRQRLIEQYGNSCNICDTPFTSAPRIDHEHSTGRVRGLLCATCNAGLGYLKDSPEILEAARTYLLNYENSV